MCVHDWDIEPNWREGTFSPKCSKCGAEPCVHELILCPHCDVVFCLKCAEEWTKDIAPEYFFLTTPGYSTDTFSTS